MKKRNHHIRKDIKKQAHRVREIMGAEKTRKRIIKQYKKEEKFDTADGEF